MRNTVTSGLLIRFCLLSVLLPDFLESLDKCTQFSGITFPDYESKTFENLTHRKSDHYYYTQVIRRQQPRPVVNGNFKEFQSSQNIRSVFWITFYGEHYRSFEIDRLGRMQFYDPDNKITSGGLILPVTFLPENSHFRSFSTESMLAMELTFSSTKQLTKITCLIHVNGKITIFYDEIASGNHETELDSKIYSSFKCGEGSPGSLPYNAIHVPGSWIQSNTLVELEPMTNFCSRQQSSESCKAASKPGVICYWCATAKICSNGLDTHTAVLRQNNCDKEIIEKLTGDNLEVNRSVGSHQYLYILMPVVVTLFILIVACVLGILIYKRKTNMIRK